jgi:hypothetical protein
MDVATVTLGSVTEADDVLGWLVVAIRVPASPSRHRVAIWRELRRVGAVSLGGGTWAVPAAPVFADGLVKVADLVARAEGSVVTFDAAPRTPADRQALLAEFNGARAAEWAEFSSECDKFEAEIAKERRIGKLTVAELDEEEHSLDRLRRWWRDLRARDIFTVAEGVDAEDRLRRCTETLDAYADEVYAAAHAPLGRSE